MSDMLNLGNYAPYILGAMGIALLLMTFEPLLLRINRGKIIKEIKRTKRLSERRGK